MEGDVVAWTPTKIEDIKVGDIIVFKSMIHWPDEKIVVHRVADITVNKAGDILLTTKGDKNEYTDQAGPHIPEPYIRDYNVMGKIITVGPFPLKVPFIGVFGIWLNQGIELLSQPTASKDSISFAGVFAPLTISAVILVVLIFILPEKATTFKEKLRYFIFGPRPLNLKRTLVSFLVIYIIMLSVIHVFAFDSLSASVGVDANDTDASIEFGRIKPGYTSTVRELPIINPSTMHVKGFIFGTGQMSEFVTRKGFNLSRGNFTSIPIKAVATNTTPNGTYYGDIVVFSSPFWSMFPDNFIETLYTWSGEGAIFVLDLLTAIILTSLTILILIIITITGDRVNAFMIDHSWVHPSRIVLKRSVIKRFRALRTKAKKSLGKSMGWVLKIEYRNIDSKKAFFSVYKKPITASLVVAPLLFLINEPMLAMFLSVISGGIIAYTISCKIRNKIVLTVFITMIISTIVMMVESNIVVFQKDVEFSEMIALSFGLIGVYLLVFTLLLVPMSALAWYLTRIIRNLKEQKDPLLSLEGSCDL